MTMSKTNQTGEHHMAEDQKYERDPSEEVLDRAAHCVLVPTDYPADPDIIGPFATYEEAEEWAQMFEGGKVRVMAPPELVVLSVREHGPDTRMVPSVRSSH
jgi:hypothetical protein